MTMVLRQAFLLSLLGVAIGCRWLCRRKAGQQGTGADIAARPLALVAAVCILLVLGVAATFVPARQAAAVNPVAALRSE
jgi:ABC-type lipoprotein release transport system permease subunit